METLFELPPVVVDGDRKQKRKWENAFQRWSNEKFEDSSTPEGCCGTGTLCDWCEDNSFGRPCVRAFNEMCRELRVFPDYRDFDFQKWWYWNGNKDAG